MAELTQQQLNDLLDRLVQAKVDLDAIKFWVGGYNNTYEGSNSSGIAQQLKRVGNVIENASSPLVDPIEELLNPLWRIRESLELFRQAPAVNLAYAGDIPLDRLATTIVNVFREPMQNISVQATTTAVLMNSLLQWFVIYGAPGGGGGGGGGGTVDLSQLTSYLSTGEMRAKVDMGDGWAETFGSLAPELRDLSKLGVNAGKRQFDDVTANIAPHSIPGVLAGAGDFITGLFGITSCRPEDAKDNCVKAYALTTALGVGASLAAAAGSFMGLGTGWPGMGNVAAVLGEMAGYQPVNRAIIGTLADAYLSRPFRYAIQAQGRPTLPDAGTAVRLYWTRKLADSPGGSTLPRQPYTARQLLEFAGYADPWISTLLTDADRDPDLRAIPGLMQIAPRNDAWVKSALRELSYNEQAVADVAGLVKWRARSSGVNDVAAELERQVERGFMDLEQFTAALVRMEYPRELTPYRVEAASARQTFWVLNRKLDWITDSWEAGLMDADTFKAAVEELIVVPRVAGEYIIWATQKRYPKMALLSAYGEAREIRSEARRAVVLGIYGWPYYATFLSALGWTDPLIEAEHFLVTEDRDRQIVADVRSYHLPELRDSLLEGLITIAQYEATLKNLEVRDDIRHAEVNYMKVALERRRRGRVERYQIPALEEAYVQGLIVWQPVANAMQDAGYSSRERDLARDVLTLRRARNLEARAVKAERARSAAMLSAQAEEDQKAKAAAAVAAAALKAKAALLKGKDPAAVAAAADLVDTLDALYDQAHQLMPDSVYNAALELRDAATDPAGPDYDRLWELTDDLAARLDAAAGESN